VKERIELYNWLTLRFERRSRYYKLHLE